MPRRGGGWPRETVLPHWGKPTPPRFARLPLPEEGARMIFKETLIQSLPFAVRDSRSPPHVPCTSPLSSSVFHSAGALSAPLSPSFLWKEVPRRGGGWPRETVLPHSGKPTPPRFARLPLPEEGARMIFKETRIKSLSFAVRDSRSPHMCRALLHFPHLSFMPLEPYPPLRGTFPTRGRLVCRGYPLLKRRRSRHLNPEPRT